MLRTGLLALQVALALACGGLVWRIAVPLWQDGPRREIQLTVPAPPPRPVPAQATYDTIAARNLFAAGAVGTPPATRAPVEKLVASRLKVRLLGTAATQPPELGVASLEDASTREQVSVRAGDSLAGATVRRIERGRVVVDNAGHLEEIVFDKADSPSSSGKGASARPRRGDAARRAAAPGPLSRAARISARVQQLTERFKHSAAVRARSSGQAIAPAAPRAPIRVAESGAKADSSQGARGERPKRRVPFFQQAQTTPEWSRQGGMLGLRVRDVKGGTDVEQAGLRRGDLVTEVNGVALKQVAQSYGAIRSAMNAGAATFKVEREGKSLDLVVGKE